MGVSTGVPRFAPHTGLGWKGDLSAEVAVDLRENSRHIRAFAAMMPSVVGSGHTGGSWSSADLLATLYACKKPEEPVVYSIAHITPAVYSLLAGYGAFPIEEALTHFRFGGSQFDGHVDRHMEAGDGCVLGRNPLPWSAGNLGQGLSAGAAFAYYYKHIEGSNRRVWVLMGDGDGQKGQHWEAANFASKYRLNNLVAVMDRNHRQIMGATEDVMPMNYGGMFRAAGWSIDRCDGHGIEDFRRVVMLALSGKERPAFIEAETVMMKGAGPPYEGSHEWHGKPLPDGDLDTILERLGVDFDYRRLKEVRNSLAGGLRPLPKPELAEPDITKLDLGRPITYNDARKGMRHAYGAVLADLAKLNNVGGPRVIGVDCDLGESTHVSKIAAADPSALVQCGIQEHNAAAFAGALSTMPDTTVFFSTFGVFALDEVFNQQRLNDINRTNLKVAATHLGLNVGEDGKTHHCTDYVGLARNLYGFTTIIPADANQADRAIRWAAGRRGNVFIGMPRTDTPVVRVGDKPFFGGDYKLRWGKDDWVRKGEDGAIVAMGCMVPRALEVGDALTASGYDFGVVSRSWPTIIDEEVLAELVDYNHVVTLEDHNVNSGMGSILADAMLQLCGKRAWSPPRFLKLGVTGYAPAGRPDELYRLQGLDTPSLVETILAELE